jgi:hypothetical protein
VTIHFVTCGTSILSQADLLEPLGVQAATDADSARVVASKLGAPLTEADTPSWQSWCDGLVGRLQDPNLGLDTKRAEEWSAELTSLFGDNLLIAPVAGADTVVLMASATGDGFTAAIVVAVVLFVMLPSLGPPICLRSPAEIGVTEHRLLIVQQPDLDPMGGLFEQGLESIVDTMLAVPGRDVKPCVTHLAGGFKATIPFLVLVLSAYRRSVNSRMTARIAFQTDNAREVLLVPLSRMAGSELRAIAALSTHPKPGSTLDQLYSGSGGLKPIGRALAKLAAVMPKESGD